MTIYEKFRSSSLDLSALGLQYGPSVCEGGPAPANARILAWLTDSPVHFCQIPEQGSTVYSVAPGALPEEQILPVAKDIPEFIGLLVCCQDAALIAGAYQWSRFRFAERIAAVCPGMKALSVMRALKNTYHPPVIRNPGAVLTQLREEFEPQTQTSHWSVGFEADFDQECPKGAAGKELALKRSIGGKGGTWLIPAVYLFNEGIVVDAVWEVSSQRLLDFQDCWGSRSQTRLSLPEKLQRQIDNPLSANVTGVLSVNDKPIRCKKSFTAIWNPLLDNGPSERRILRHYRLDPDRGYLFRRYCFLRKGNPLQIRTMQLNLEAVPVMVPEKVFTVQRDGERFSFAHPVTGLEHIFTAVSISPEALNPNFLTNHPCFYSRLTYTLEPSISPENFRLVDRDPGDDWEGYQDDPAAVIYADKKPDPGRYALSALHYEPRNEIRWQMIFRRKLHKDVQLKLMP